MSLQTVQAIYVVEKAEGARLAVYKDYIKAHNYAQWYATFYEEIIFVVPLVLNGADTFVYSNDIMKLELLTPEEE